jgi:hypothetical protein
MALVGLAIYLGIGAMLHALFVGAKFDWSSAWTFGWLLGWPIMGFVGLIAFGLVIMAVVFPLMWFQEWNERREARNRREDRLRRNQIK